MKVKKNELIKDLSLDRLKSDLLAFLPGLVVGLKKRSTTNDSITGISDDASDDDDVAEVESMVERSEVFYIIRSLSVLNK